MPPLDDLISSFNGTQEEFKAALQTRQTNLTRRYHAMKSNQEQRISNKKEAIEKLKLDILDREDELDDMVF